MSNHYYIFQKKLFIIITKFVHRHIYIYFTGDTGDKDNYRPIALVTAASKNLEICLLEILEMYLITHDHQFGFNPIWSGLFDVP